jgi:hypothetical protein
MLDRADTRAEAEVWFAFGCDFSNESRPVMNLLTDAARTIVPTRGHWHGPLPPLPLVLTLVTGLLNAGS